MSNEYHLDPNKSVNIDNTNQEEQNVNQMLMMKKKIKPKSKIWTLLIEAKRATHQR